MKPTAPYGLAVVESCFSCPLREDGLFCRIPVEARGELNRIRQTSYFPRGAVLFVEGESPRGLFVLCSGQAKLSANSIMGRSITLRLIEPGEVLGLSSVVSNTAYRATAETRISSQVGFIPRPDFIAFLNKYAEVGVRVAEHFSMELHQAWEQTRLLALTTSAQAKLAQLLLVSAQCQGPRESGSMRVPLNMTQEEIGHAIGAARETVSRLLADFKRRRLISVRGGTILVIQPDELRALVGT